MSILCLKTASKRTDLYHVTYGLIDERSRQRKRLNVRGIFYCGAFIETQISCDDPPDLSNCSAQLQEEAYNEVFGSIDAISLMSKIRYVVRQVRCCTIALYLCFGNVKRSGGRPN